MYRNGTNIMPRTVRSLSLQVVSFSMMFLHATIAAAASASIGFSGRVAEFSANSPASYPKVVTSFSDEAALPLDEQLLSAARSGTLFGEAIDGTAGEFQVEMIFVQKADGAVRAAVVVPLVDLSQQRFMLCDRSNGWCLTYRVLRIG